MNPYAFSTSDGFLLISLDKSFTLAGGMTSFTLCTLWVNNPYHSMHLILGLLVMGFC
jgi:hypothetical protein